MKHWQRLSLFIAAVALYTPELWAATVSTHRFGRYEIVLQEGTAIAMGEILGVVRRHTGLPEYPLMLGLAGDRLVLNLLGPANRPLQLTAGERPGPSGTRPQMMSLILGRSVRQEDLLVLHVRYPKRAQRVTLRVNLASLERMLEGER